MLTSQEKLQLQLRELQQLDPHAQEVEDEDEQASCWCLWLYKIYVYICLWLHEAFVINISLSVEISTCSFICCYYVVCNLEARAAKKQKTDHHSEADQGWCLTKCLYNMYNVLIAWMSLMSVMSLMSLICPPCSMPRVIAQSVEADDLDGEQPQRKKARTGEQEGGRPYQLTYRFVKNLDCNSCICLLHVWR